MTDRSSPVSETPDDVMILLGWLKDPVTVHLNMLRGTIAKPTWEQIKHLYPEQFAGHAQSSREAVIEECAKAVEETMWTLPLYADSNNINVATGEAATIVIRQAADTVRALSDTSTGQKT